MSKFKNVLKESKISIFGGIKNYKSENYGSKCTLFLMERENSNKTSCMVRLTVQINLDLTRRPVLLKNSSANNHIDLFRVGKISLSSLANFEHPNTVNSFRDSNL